MSLTDEEGLQELDRLRKASTKFYRSNAGKAQLAWLQQLEDNLLGAAIKASDPTARLSCLDQAKGIRAFRAYLDTLTKKD